MPTLPDVISPPPWITFFAADGSPYYFNQATQETSATLPDQQSLTRTVSSSVVIVQGGIPIPGHASKVGWQGEISRGEAEERLKGKPSGTFLTRWSSNSQSYVLSYTKGNVSEHIAFIKPGPDNVSVSVVRADTSTATYSSLMEYINAMISTRLISAPVTHFQSRNISDAQPIYHQTPLRNDSN